MLMCSFCVCLSGALFDGSNWKLHLLQFGLTIYFSFGILMSALQIVNYLLLHKVRLSLRQFYIDLIDSLWLIGQLIKILSYPGNTNTIVEIVIVYKCSKKTILIHYGMQKYPCSYTLSLGRGH